MREKFKLLFIGDIVGRPGRKVVTQYLSQYKYDFVIANVENASHGFGLTQKNHDELLNCGINAMTSGNHIWDKKDILSYINQSNVLIRPLNYNNTVSGVGYRIFDNIVVINLLGRTFMPPIDCPFTSLNNLIEKLKNEIDLNDKIIFVDFHAEATAEKQCFAKYAFELGVDVVIGTHTHIATADEIIINNHAYQTDAGFCGSTNGVIGMEYMQSYKRLLTSINERFEVDNELPYALNATEIEFSFNKPINIKRINYNYNADLESSN